MPPIMAPEYRKKRIVILTTGGTIEKSYDEDAGTLVNNKQRVDRMLSRLTLHGVDVEVRQLMNKDSLDMSDADHALIVQATCELAQSHDGLIIVHGTDRLAVTGERLCEDCGALVAPVVLTGAMRPYELKSSDALQNLTEALVGVQLLDPGVWVCMHNRIIPFPGVEKDHRRRTFVRVEELDD